MNIFATLGILFFGLFLIRPLLLVLRIPRNIIMPIIFVLCTVGSFAISQRLFDIWTMLLFGFCGFILRQLNYHMAPFVLGLVLGDLMDKNLRRGLVLSDGDLTPFFTRPICAVLVVIVAIMLLMNFKACSNAVDNVKAALMARLRRT
jgi:putative tricarboxylic transport membrane protein